MNINELKTMSVEERLKTMEMIWGTFSTEENDIASPEWHHDILTERKQKIENGEAKFISLEALRQYR